MLAGGETSPSKLILDDLEGTESLSSFKTPFHYPSTPRPPQAGSPSTLAHLPTSLGRHSMYAAIPSERVSTELPTISHGLTVRLGSGGVAKEHKHGTGTGTAWGATSLPTTPRLGSPSKAGGIIFRTYKSHGWPCQLSFVEAYALTTIHTATQSPQCMLCVPTGPSSDLTARIMHFASEGEESNGDDVWSRKCR